MAKERMEEGHATPLVFLKTYGLIIGLFLLGVGFLLYGGAQYLGKESTSDVTFATQQHVQLTLTPSSVTTEIFVDIEGAVRKPGVYQLENGARLEVLVAKAGGYTTTVDKEKVAKGLNLASKLTDGAKIYVPFIGEDEPASVGEQTTLGASSVSNGLININSASTEELDTLPGVGAVTAGKIIANRPYSNLDELVSKKALGQATFEKIKDKITAQ